MSPFIHTLFFAASPIIGIAIVWSLFFQDITTSVFPLWNKTPKNPQVTLAQGIVIGTILDHKFPAPIEAFMGLPYAQPPTGDRRFRRAIALPESNQTFKAHSYGPMYEITRRAWI